MTLHTKSIVKKLLSKASLLVPKDKKRVVIFSPWTHGNTEIVYNEITANHPSLEVKRFGKKDLLGFSKQTFKNLHFFYSAKFLLTSHAVCEFKSPNQIHISLFHGLPVKKIGFISPEMEGKNYPDNFLNKNIDYHVVSSYLSGAIFSSAWNLPEKKMLYFGEPILDELSQKKHTTKRPENEILYCPTWRNDSDYMYAFVDHAINKSDISWTVSPHPADVEKFKAALSDSPTANITLHETGSVGIMHEFQHVYMDISSVFYYLVFTEVDITIFFPDRENYLKNFGCLFSKFEIFGEMKEGEVTHSITATQKTVLKELFFADYSGDATIKIVDFIKSYYDRK